MSHAAQIQALLESLGATADEVEATLRANGIKGVRNTVRFLNPLVRYLRKQLPVDASVDVIRRDKARLAFWNGNVEEVPISEATRQFMDAFDVGAYPELELPPEAALP